MLFIVNGIKKALVKVKNMKTLIVKSLLSSLCQREELYPSLVKRG